MKHAGNLSYSAGARKSKKRIGRGPGSGHGGTATRGHKGAQSRRNYKTKPGFEGGQMPLHRRTPKFGFFNRDRKEYQIVNLDRLQQLADENKLQNGLVSFDVLVELGVITKKGNPLKVLGSGEIKTALTIQAHKISESAKQKIESAGGTVTVHE